MQSCININLEGKTEAYRVLKMEPFDGSAFTTSLDSMQHSDQYSLQLPMKYVTLSVLWFEGIIHLILTY